MVPKPAFSKKDEDKTREELAEDLKKSRAAMGSLKEIIPGQQKFLDIHQTMPVKREELEARREPENCAILDDIDVGIIKIDDESVISYANLKAGELLDPAHAIPSLVGNRLSRLPGFDVSHQFRLKYDKVKETGTPERFEETLPSNQRLRYNLSPSGEGMAIVVEDITGDWMRDEAQRAALLSLNSLGESVFLVRESEYMVYANETASRATGYSWDELTHSRIGDIIPALGGDKLKGIGDLSGSRIIFESEMRGKDGRSIPVTVSVTQKRFYNADQYIVAARDITERKCMEDSVKRSERYLASIFEGFQEGISILDKDMNIVKVNHAMEEWYPHMLPLVGKKCYQAYQGRTSPCEDCPSLRSMREKTMQTSIVPFTNEHSLAGWMELYSFPLLDDEGKVTGVIEHVRDITERKKIEEALREREEKYRELVENANSIIIRWDMWGNLTFFNEFAEKLFGYSKDDVLGKNVIGTIVPLSESTGRDLGGLIEDIKWYPERYKFNVNENMCKNGDRVWIAWTNKAIHDEHGNVVEILSVGNDITDRKRAEEALRESERRFRGIYEQAPLGIALIDSVTGRFLKINQKYCDIVGRTMEEMLAMDFQSITYPDDLQADLDNMARLIAGEITGFQMEKRYDHANGSIVWVNLIVVPLWEANSPNKCHIAMVEDITERMQAEEELKAAKQQAELYLDLMGHDINNMHQVALGYLELARDMTPSGEQVQFLDKPMEVLQRSAQLIQNVRKLQKLHEGVLQTENVDVSRVLTDVQREFGSVPGKRIMLNTNGYGNCLVRANELLHDVFANLVSNAIKHTGDGTGIVIDLDAIKDGGVSYCRVMVEDNGPGIPDDHKDTIFNRKLKGTGKTKGMGLGLYLVKTLVGSYGGRVWAEDRVKGEHSKGARFVVMLPVAEK